MFKLWSLDLQVSFATWQKELIAGKIKVLSQSFGDNQVCFWEAERNLDICRIEKQTRLVVCTEPGALG